MDPPEMGEGQWQVRLNVPTSDREGGDPCSHARNLRSMIAMNKQLIAVWELPYTIVYRKGEQYRTICLECAVEQAHTLYDQLHPPVEVKNRDDP